MLVRYTVLDSEYRFDTFDEFRLNTYNKRIPVCHGTMAERILRWCTSYSCCSSDSDVNYSSRYRLLFAICTFFTPPDRYLSLVGPRGTTRSQIFRNLR
jgi:hypothetical protein